MDDGLDSLRYLLFENLYFCTLNHDIHSEGDSWGEHEKYVQRGTDLPAVVYDLSESVTLGMKVKCPKPPGTESINLDEESDVIDAPQQSVPPGAPSFHNDLVIYSSRSYPYMRVRLRERDCTHSMWCMNAKYSAQGFQMVFALIAWTEVRSDEEGVGIWYQGIL